MSNHIQYITDKKGRKHSVVVHFSDWEETNEKYLKLLNKVRILSRIIEGISEVKRARKKGEPLQTLVDFLKEI